MMAKRWQFRRSAFKIGVGGLIASYAIFLLGFSVPAWRNAYGLWMDCEHTCVTLSAIYGVPGWFQSVRVMECLAMVGFTLALAVEIYQDLYKTTVPAPDGKYVELLALGAGFFGLAGVIVFGVFTPGTTASFESAYRLSLQWGFGLTAAASCLAIIFAIIIAFNRRIGPRPGGILSALPVRYSCTTGCLSELDLSPLQYGLPAHSLGVLPPPYDECVAVPNGKSLASSALAQTAVPGGGLSVDVPPHYTSIFPPPPPYSLSPQLHENPSHNQTAAIQQALPEIRSFADSNAGQSAVPSQIPSYFLVVQGHAVPVYNQHNDVSES